MHWLVRLSSGRGNRLVRSVFLSAGRGNRLLCAFVRFSEAGSNWRDTTKNEKRASSGLKHTWYLVPDTAYEMPQLVEDLAL